MAAPWVYAAGLALLATAGFVLPGAGTLLWGAVGLSSVAAILVGVRRHRPRRRWPWWLLAAGMLTFTAGDVTYSVEGDRFPSLADAWYLAMYPLVAAGLLGLARSGARGRDLAGLLDTLALTSGLALLSWVLLIGPSLGTATGSHLEKALLATYALADVALLATLARLLTAARRSATVTLLMVGAGGTLLSDTLYGLAVANDSYHSGSPIDLGWIVFYGAWGAAALHPSMARLTEPALPRHGEVSPRRLMLLVLSSLVAPGVLVTGALTGPPRAGLVVALLSVATVLFVLGRLADAANTLRRAVARERGLRRAAAALLAATGTDEVSAAVRTAVAQLLPPGTAYRLVFADRTTTIRPAALRYTRDIEPPIGAQLAGFEYTVVCPFVHNRQSGGLFVAADWTALKALRDSLEVLAWQAAMALERIALSNELSRRASEEYFRTLVQNAADVILIVGADNRIRYASPSAVAVFGWEPLTGTALHDVVHSEDGVLVCRALDLKPGQWEDWCTVRRPDGGRVPVEVTCRDLRHDRSVAGLVVTLRDVTEQRRLHQELSWQAYHDSLTGLANRALFAQRVEQAVARSYHSGGTVGILFIDLDDFKAVNDTMGHTIGDALLIEVGERLSAILGPGDVAARLGGDEFAAVTCGTGHPVEVEQIAQRVVAALAEPIRLPGRVITCVASVGVATTGEGAGADAGELLRQADLALYLAKGAGKGRWRRYHPGLHAVPHGWSVPTAVP